MANDDAVDVTPVDVTPVDVTPVDVTPDPAAGAAGPERTARPPRPAPPLRERARDVVGRLRAPSLQTSLLGILVVAVAVAVAMAGAASVVILRAYLTDQIDDQLERSLGSLLREPGRLEQAYQQSQFTGRNTSALPSDYVIQVGMESSSQPYTLVGETAQTEKDIPRLRTAAANRTQADYYVATSENGAHWRAVTAPVPNTQLTVSVALPMTGIESAVRRLLVIVLGAGLVVVALGGVLGRWAIRRAFVPLREMEDSAVAIGDGDLARRVPAGSPSTEVGRLGAALNGMLAQIERAFRARETSEARTRRFAADASHELRTPVTAIRGFAELYRQGAVKDPDDVARVMKRIEDEATRMGSLVEDLLLLARLDERRPAKLEEVDLAVLAGDAVHDARAMDRDRTISLIGVLPGTGPRPALVTGDNNRLRQVLTNLVANALRHTPAGTPVEVAVGVYPHATGDFALLEVRDHGGGIAAEDAERVFERFYRVDASRQRGKGGGSGLGLSIVAAVVEQHGGRVDIVPTPGGGATFRVSLPLRAGTGGEDDAATAPPGFLPPGGSTEVIDS